MFMSKFKSVMVIDDDEINNFLCERIIIQTDFAEQVVTSQSGLQALQQLTKLVENGSIFPSIIFLDINMPEMNGWQFLDEYKKLDDVIRKNSKIYMLSSSVYSNDIEKAQKHLLVVDYLTKPLTGDILKKIN